MMWRLLTVLTTMVVFALVFASCGGDDSVDNVDSDPRAASPSMEERVAGDVDVEMADDADSAQSSQTGTLLQSGIDRRVIRNGELDARVSDVPAAVRHARTVVEDYGGYIAESSARTFAEDDRSAYIVVDVPAEAFENVLDALRDGPYVTRIAHESTSSRDVTEEFVDLQAQLRNLKATEARFTELLDEARTIDEILRVEQELNRVRGEIERIEGRINYLEQRTATSRINVSYSLDDKPVQIAGWQFTPGETAREAWSSSLQFVGQLATAAITVVVFFWWAWPLVIIGAVIGLRYYRRQRSHLVTA